MKYTEKITVGKAKAKELQKFLDGKGTDSDEIIDYFTAHFVEAGIGVEIKVCDVQDNGFKDSSGPYVDPVLFEVLEATEEEKKVGILYQWHEIGPIEVTDTLLGEYHFEDEGNEYIVEVVA